MITKIEHFSDRSDPFCGDPTHFLGSAISFCGDPTQIWGGITPPNLKTPVSSVREHSLSSDHPDQSELSRPPIPSSKFNSQSSIPSLNQRVNKVYPCTDKQRIHTD